MSCSLKDAVCLTLSNKENQGLAKDAWKDAMTHAGEAMGRAQEKIREDKQFQDMAESLGEALSEAKKRFGEDSEDGESQPDSDNDHASSFGRRLSSWFGSKER